MAVQAFAALDLSGMARVDFFVTRRTHRVVLNEVNTLPGFTSISMYPKLWEASGIPYSQLIDKLITLAIERHAVEQKLKTTSLERIIDISINERLTRTVMTASTVFEVDPRASEAPFSWPQLAGRSCVGGRWLSYVVSGNGFLRHMVRWGPIT